MIKTVEIFDRLNIELNKNIIPDFSETESENEIENILKEMSLNMEKLSEFITQLVKKLG